MYCDSGAAETDRPFEFPGDPGPPGDRLRPIAKGECGRLSKVREELEGAEDAQRQGDRIRLLCELSDLVGAVVLVLEREFAGTITVEDLLTNSRRRPGVPGVPGVPGGTTGSGRLR